MGGGWRSVAERLVGSGTADEGGRPSLGHIMRQRRWATLWRTFPDLAEMRVLDLGGTPDGWSAAPVLPAQLTLVNPSPPSDDLPDGMEHVSGDACQLPEEVRDGGWDLVYSNSVIEHVGGHARRQQFAEVARSCAPSYWVQTPYRYFPIEPHWLFPGFQFLPVPARRAVAMRWPLHPGRRDDPAAALDEVLDIELLSRTEVCRYFPDCELLVERAGGLAKSLIALRVG